MNTTPTGRERIELIINALEIAANNYEYEGDIATAEKMIAIVKDMESN